MKKMKKIIPSILGLFLGGTCSAATSSVILDPPDIATIIDSMYDAAQPLYNSVSNWVYFLLGILFVGFVLGKIIGAFLHRD